METHKEEWEKELDRWLHDEAVLTKLKIQQLLTHQKQTIMDMCDEMRTDKLKDKRIDDYHDGDVYTDRDMDEYYNLALSDLKEKINKI